MSIHEGRFDNFKEILYFLVINAEGLLKVITTSSIKRCDSF